MDYQHECRPSVVVVQEIEQRINPPTTLVTSTDVIRIISWWHELTMEEITGLKRDTELVLARSAAAWCMRAIFGVGLTRIGQRLGGRDPSTIVHGLKKAGEVWGLPSPCDRGSDLIARHYLKTGEWDVSKAKGVAA